MKIKSLTVGSILLAVTLTARAEIKARGSDSTLHVLKALATAYETETGKKVTLEGGGSGAGVKALIAGDVTLAFLSRELKAEEKQAGLTGQAYAQDGVAVVVHKDNPATNLTLAELKDLFTGKTTAWPDGKPVVLFNRNADSGTREVFQEHVMGKDAFSEKAAVKHDAVLLNSLTKIPGAIAYTSLAEADETSVKILTINGVKPGAQSLRDKTYPVGRTPTLATKGDATGEEKGFIDFVLSPKGQAVVSKEGLVPIH